MGLVVGDDREAGRIRIAEPGAKVDQQGEHRGIDERAPGEVDDERLGAGIEGAVDGRRELTHGGQVELAVHFNRRDIGPDRVVGDFGAARCLAPPDVASLVIS